MIYLDHAATTPCRPEAIQAMLPFLGEVFGNPSSIHAAGQASRRALDEARDQVAEAIGACPEEVFFTSSGTEADNLALVGAFLASSGGRKHLISTKAEHKAILKTLEFLQGLGAEVTYLPLDEYGTVDPDDLRRAIRSDTLLVSLMWANNEVGTLAPMREISRITTEAGVLLHTDAVQVAGALPMDVNDPRVDLLSLSAHKFYGPKGIGALYIRRGVSVQPILYGGTQERKRRPGTENVPGIVGMAAALSLAAREVSETAPRVTGLRDQLIGGVLGHVPGAVLNGHPTGRLPNNASFSFPGLETEMLLLNLDLEGVAASSGSACTAGAVEPSHVLSALGYPYDRAISGLRFSLGRTTTESDVSEAARILAAVVRRLRS